MVTSDKIATGSNQIETKSKDNDASTNRIIAEDGGYKVNVIGRLPLTGQEGS